MLAWKGGRALVLNTKSILTHKYELNTKGEHYRLSRDVNMSVHQLEYNTPPICVIFMKPYKHSEQYTTYLHFLHPASIPICLH